MSGRHWRPRPSTGGWPAGSSGRSCGAPVSPDGPNADDFVITTQAALAHDTTDRLAGLSGPALLVGGVDDPFFPEPVLRATAGTRMQLRLLPGGHGVPKRHAGRLQTELSAFFTA